MLFTKVMATLLGAVAFASAIPLDSVDSTVVARDGSIQKRASKETWDKLTKLCKGDSIKRSLEARDKPKVSPPSGFTEVGVGDMKDSSKDGLWTYYLISCAGVGVTGTQTISGFGSPRILWHSYGSLALAQGQWGDFEKKVKNQMLKDLQGYLSLPDTKNGLPDGWTKDMTDAMENEFIPYIKKQVHDLTGKDAKIILHNMKDAQTNKAADGAGTMQIDKDNKAKADGKAF